MYRWLLLVFAVAPFVFTFAYPSETPELVWWTTHALDKVRPYDREPQPLNHSVSISAARNEFEPFQVILRSISQDVEGVDIEISDLKGRGSAKIPNNNITVYLERYMDVKMPSAVDTMPGEWPDPLVPRIDRYAGEKRNAFPFRLTAGRNQPIWIDVYVPPSSSAGTYSGSLRLTVPGHPPLTVPMQVEVWDFELPSTSSLPTTFGFSGVAALRQHFGKYTTDPHMYELVLEYRKSALWHRLSLHGGGMVPPAFSVVGGEVKVDWNVHDRENGPFLDGTVFSAGDPLPGAKATTVSVGIPPALKTDAQQIQFWRQVAAHFRKKGWFDRLFNYLWDEPKPEQYAEMIRRGHNLHRADPGLKNLVTAPLRQEWTGLVDIWTPVINCFEQRPPFEPYCGIVVERSGYNPELGKGKLVWWYQACGSHGCNIVGGDYFRDWPSYMIDHSGIRNRIMEWMTWKYEVQGELYFNMNEAFGRGKDPWTDLRLFGGNGDGTLFYPGTPDRIGGKTHIPVESIRMKLIREGLEDYEYLVMFERLAGAEPANALVDTLIRKTYDFERKPEMLYAARDAMGRDLSRAAKK